jgi:hypothetical protein
MSKDYKNTVGLREIAKGNEAVVYRIDHVNSDEVVLKCILDHSNDEYCELQDAFVDLMNET